MREILEENMTIRVGAITIDFDQKVYPPRLSSIRPSFGSTPNNRSGVQGPVPDLESWLDSNFLHKRCSRSKTVLF